jgi:hypothetical protein
MIVTDGEQLTKLSNGDDNVRKGKQHPNLVHIVMQIQIVVIEMIAYDLTIMVNHRTTYATLHQILNKS